VNDLGNIALWLALLIGLWGSAVAFLAGRGGAGTAGLRASAERSAYVVFGLLAIAAAALLRALLRHDFSLEYVAAYTSRNLPLFYTWSAFYAGQKGSLLLWAVVLAAFTALVVAQNRRRHRALMPYVTGVLLVIVTFFVAVMVFTTNPFERLASMPPDGNGLNPQLQNPGMVFHPPLLYLGYIGIAVPYAFAVAALLSGKPDAGWLEGGTVRRWALLSWLFLSAGIVLGMWWAYVELGWGGYWAWDPVENASLMPWLTLTAFLHSVVIQEQRGMLRRWNLGLAIATFLLTIFGTFITRSGFISSVHSFARTNLGWFFLAFLVLSGVGSFALLARGWPRLAPSSRLESLLSREAAFLLNNLVFVTIAFAVFWGTLFPSLSQWLGGARVAVGPPFFNQVSVPLGLLLLALTGVGPLIAWRRAGAGDLKRQLLWPVAGMLATGAALAALGVRDVGAATAFALAALVLVAVAQELARGAASRRRQYREIWPLAVARLVARNRRRYGGYVVHVGVAMMFVGFAGAAFKRDTEVTLRPGQSAELRSPFGNVYRFTHQGVSLYDQLNRFVTAAALDVYRDGRYLGVMRSEKRQHFDSLERPSFEPSTEVAIRSGVREDLYVVFAGEEGNTEEAAYRIAINPLVWWVWFGGLVLALGGIVALWPAGRSPTRGVA